LSITTVDVGLENLLHIVCGASNVAAGQKVIVASVGAKLYPTNGEPFEIKKSKIRGAVSEGMICAEDEIGMGTSHEGIMILSKEAKIGTAVKDYFKIESDFIFEIGLTPNRADAASHIGVARDLAAVLANLPAEETGEMKQAFQVELPSVNNFQTDNSNKKIEVVVEDTVACPRYSGITISNVEIKESPQWLKNRLKSIALKPINNVVDATNFILHELGQPLHAFDADKINGHKVIVKKLPAKTNFKTLDGIERKLSDEDLMICNSKEGMCIAGVFGGMESGIKETTKNIFIESAYFDPVHIRKTSKRHGLKTDASFRYERGTDPNITVYALKRAAMMIKELTGGEISSEVIDIYPKPVENFKVPFSFENCNRLIGKNIDKDIIKNILKSLNIEIINEGNDGLLLSVPPYKVDVQREADVIEEVLRIYGYNNVEIPVALRSSLPVRQAGVSYSPKPNVEKIQSIISDLLSSNGFNEILTNSLSKGEYYQNTDRVVIINPLSTELDTMRQTLLYSGLEAIAYNQNRKKTDLKFFEFGKVYRPLSSANKKTGLNYEESRKLSLFICGKKDKEHWSSKNKEVNIYGLRAYVEDIFLRIGVNSLNLILNNEKIEYQSNKKTLVYIESLSKNILKKFDIKQEIYFAEFNWDNIIEIVKNNSIVYKEVPKFPEVRRDLALLIDKSIQYQQLEQLAYQTEKKLLKEVTLFDVYEGDKIEAGKKSYAMSFILQDENATLTDQQIDKVMEKLIKAYQQETGAAIR
jgi:phenylalanyl-tRNA synthetase beta chain